MSWTNEDGVHEGWCAAEFAGGWLSVAWTAPDQVDVRRPGPDGRLDYTTEPERRSLAEILGWRAGCECGWRGTYWERTTDPAEHSPADRRVYVPDHDPGALWDAPADVEDAAHQEWKGHLEPKSLTAVRAAAEAVGAAQARLADAVRAARLDGRSWADVGTATGMTRQSAHERWSTLDLTWMWRCRDCGQGSGGYNPRPRTDPDYVECLDCGSVNLAREPIPTA